MKSGPFTEKDIVNGLNSLKTNEEQTEGMEPNKGLISKWGYRKTLLGVLIAGIIMLISLFRGC